MEKSAEYHTSGGKLPAKNGTTLLEKISVWKTVLYLSLSIDGDAIS